MLCQKMVKDFSKWLFYLGFVSKCIEVETKNQFKCIKLVKLIVFNCLKHMASHFFPYKKETYLKLARLLNEQSGYII